MGKESKIHGRPLQKLYRRLQETPGAPRQPLILKELQVALEKEGLSYHARTIKRQLLGDIEYIPQIVEELFLTWLGNSHPEIFSRVEGIWKDERAKLHQSEDSDLYVSPIFFLQAADAYLLLHKNLSRRQLALKLQQGLLAKGISIGLETLQAALSGKTQKVRKIVEDHLVEFFRQEGFASRDAVVAHVAEALSQEIPEVQKVAVGDLAERVDAFLLQAGGLSKRQLALLLRERLAKKGYDYHLSSIQSTLEGATRKTRKVVLDTLLEIYQSYGMGEIPIPNPEQLDWNHYVDAAAIPEQIQKILQGHPHLTRRQVARLMQADLKTRHFHFSLNTLQFILAGKTRRVKKVIPELLEEYLGEQGGERLAGVKNFQILSHKGRQAYDQRVLQAYERLKTATDADRDACFREFLVAREDLIRHRWEKRRPPARKKYGKEIKWEDSMGGGEEETYSTGYLASDPLTSRELEIPLSRLVS